MLITKRNINELCVLRYWDIVNKDKPLWLRPKEDITDAEYSAFYKSLMHTRDEPLAYTHFVGEGEVEFRVSRVGGGSLQWTGFESVKYSEQRWLCEGQVIVRSKTRFFCLTVHHIHPFCSNA